MDIPAVEKTIMRCIAALREHWPQSGTYTSLQFPTPGHAVPYADSPCSRRLPRGRSSRARHRPAARAVRARWSPAASRNTGISTPISSIAATTRYPSMPPVFPSHSSRRQATESSLRSRVTASRVAPRTSVHRWWSSRRCPGCARTRRGETGTFDARVDKHGGHIFVRQELACHSTSGPRQCTRAPCRTR